MSQLNRRPIHSVEVRLCIFPFFLGGRMKRKEKEEEDDPGTTKE